MRATEHFMKTTGAIKWSSFEINMDKIGVTGKPIHYIVALRNPTYPTLICRWAMELDRHTAGTVLKVTVVLAIVYNFTAQTMLKAAELVFCMTCFRNIKFMNYPYPITYVSLSVVCVKFYIHLRGRWHDYFEFMISLFVRKPPVRNIREYRYL